MAVSDPVEATNAIPGDPICSSKASLPVTASGLVFTEGNNPELVPSSTRTLPMVGCLEKSRRSDEVSFLLDLWRLTKPSCTSREFTRFKDRGSRYNYRREDEVEEIQSIVIIQTVGTVNLDAGRKHAIPTGTQVATDSGGCP